MNLLDQSKKDVRWQFVPIFQLRSVSPFFSLSRSLPTKINTNPPQTKLEQPKGHHPTISSSALHPPKSTNTPSTLHTPPHTHPIPKRKNALVVTMTSRQILQGLCVCGSHEPVFHRNLLLFSLWPLAIVPHCRLVVSACSV